jgi:hypothetical protein
VDFGFQDSKPQNASQFDPVPLLAIGYNPGMSNPDPKKAPGWMYGVAVVLALILLGIALLWRFAPNVLFLW